MNSPHLGGQLASVRNSNFDEFPCAQITAAGKFNEAGFRTYIAGRLAKQNTAIQTLVNSRLNRCINEGAKEVKVHTMVSDIFLVSLTQQYTEATVG